MPTTRSDFQLSKRLSCAVDNGGATQWIPGPASIMPPRGVTSR